MAATAGKKPPTGKGLTFEKVWAMFQETDQRMKETDRQMKETDRQMKETDRQIKETDRQIKALNQQMGGLHNTFGELAEHLVAPSIAERFNELGHNFDGIADGGYKIKDKKGKTIAEVDLLMENGECVMAVEVKAKPKIQDIEHHARRLEILREHRNSKNDKRKIRGAIAGAVFGSREKKAVAEAGFYVIEQSGDTMKIDIPEGFVPREW